MRQRPRAHRHDRTLRSATKVLVARPPWGGGRLFLSRPGPLGRGGASIGSRWWAVGGVLSGDPSADCLHDVASLGVVERVPGGDVVPARQAGAAARRGGVLGDEHGMPAVGRLTAVVARLGRGQPAFNQLLGVSADGRNAAQVHHRALPAAQPGTSHGRGAARSGAAWRLTRPSPASNDRARARLPCDHLGSAPTCASRCSSSASIPIAVTRSAQAQHADTGFLAYGPITCAPPTATLS
jgi:hypothetical protein